jgi:hypothetical protein
VLSKDRSLGISVIICSDAILAREVPLVTGVTIEEEKFREAGFYLLTGLITRAGKQFLRG